jgi:hypothetical protein
MVVCLSKRSEKCKTASVQGREIPPVVLPHESVVRIVLQTLIEVSLTQIRFLVELGLSIALLVVSCVQRSGQIKYLHSEVLVVRRGHSRGCCRSQNFYEIGKLTWMFMNLGWNECHYPIALYLSFNETITISLSLWQILFRSRCDCILDYNCKEVS